MGTDSIWEAFRKDVLRKAEDLARETWRELVEGGDAERADAWMREHGGGLLRRVLGKALSARAERLGVQGDCECGGALAFSQRRSVTLHTVLPGRDVDVRVQYGKCRSCRAGQLVLPREMKVDREGFTQELQGLALLAGVVEPYEAARRDLLGRMVGVWVSREKIKSLVTEVGAQARELLEKPETRQEPEGGAAARRGPLYVGIDGGMLNVDKRYQEAKLGCIFAEEARVQVQKKRAKLIERRVVAVRGDPGALSEILWPQAEAAGAMERTVVVLADGAPWIWNLAADLFVDRVEILDWYHADEHVSEVARALHGEGTEKATVWRRQQLDDLREDRVDEIIDRLHQLAPRQRAKYRREKLEELAAYLAKNRNRMRYKTFRDLGYHIGSGAVESTVNHVLQQRMKRPGMRWTAPGADALLALRSVYRSTGEWDRLLAYRRRAA